MNKMSTKETIDPANASNVEKKKSLGIIKLADKEFFITGVKHTKGNPGKYSKPEEIVDGKVDYWTVSVETPVILEYKEEGEIPIDNFFINKFAYQQLENIPNAIEGINNGARLGPCKTVLRKSNKPEGYDYRCFAFSSDPDF